MPNLINREGELRSLLEELKLDSFATSFADLALRAAKENLSHEAYLFELAKQEKEQRVARRTARLLRQSGLPAGKTFLTFEMECLPPARASPTGTPQEWSLSRRSGQCHSRGQARGRQESCSGLPRACPRL